MIDAGGDRSAASSRSIQRWPIARAHRTGRRTSTSTTSTPPCARRQPRRTGTRGPGEVPGVGRRRYLPIHRARDRPLRAGSPGPPADTARALGEFLVARAGDERLQSRVRVLSTLFNWENTSDFDMGRWACTSCSASVAARTAACTTAEQRRPPRWLSYVSVANVNPAAAAVKHLGGTIVNGPMEVPTGDWIAMARDPQGGAFALQSPKPGASAAGPNRPEPSQSVHPTATYAHAELLYLLHGDPAELAEALAGMRAADIAEALRELPPDARGQGAGRAAVRSRRAGVRRAGARAHRVRDRSSGWTSRSRGRAHRGDVGRPAGRPLPRAARSRARAPRSKRSTRRRGRRSSSCCSTRRTPPAAS